MENDIFCSVIIPTIGRSTLERSIRSVLDQGFNQADIEVVVVNDSGKSLPDEDWQQAELIRIINTNRRERSVARNSGAAVARGRYLIFLDDDDWLLPGACDAFWQLVEQHPQAVWLYGGIRIVDEKGETIAERNSGLEGNCFAQIMGGAWAPIQASMMQTHTFFQLGGFNPDILGTEDEDLCRRYAFSGDFANTSAVVACLFRGTTWSTSTNYLRAPQDTRLSRDRILNEQGSFRRLIASGKSSYWYGRICHLYISTMKWNLTQRKILSAGQRGLMGAFAFLGSGTHVLNQDFWSGVRAQHVPDTLHFVMETYEQKAKNQPGD